MVSPSRRTTRRRQPDDEWEANPHVDQAIRQGKTALSLLEAITEGIFICEPLKGAVKLAKELLEMVEKVRKNQEECKDLADDVFMLMEVILELLKGRQDDEIPARLKTYLVDDVYNTLLKIKSDLEPLILKKDFSFKAWRRALLRREYVADQLSGHRKKITGCLQRFNLAIVADIRMEMHAPVPSTSALPRLQISSVVPRPPKYFYGRDDIVDDVVQKLASETQHHVALLGTGGIGKTSVALSILEHPDIKPRNRCCFVPCDTLLSASALVLAILQVLGGSSGEGDTMERLIGCIKAVGPVVLVLDNFESPWDAGGTHDSLTKVLSSLSSLPGVQIVLTMRGNHPPANGGVQWTPVQLGPLDAESAKALFLTMCPDTKPAEYTDMDALLEKVDGLPLAIDLLAKQKGILPCSFLLRRWESQSTALLTTETRSPTRLTSLDVSIKLSLNSEMMKAAPDALTLLAVICRLPDGVVGGSDQLVKMNLGLEVHEALAALLRSALAYVAPGGFIKVLSPIRQHVMAHHDLPQPKYDSLMQYYVNLLDKYGSVSPGYGDFKQAYEALVPETGNIIYLFTQELRQARRCTHGVAQAAYMFSRFQCYTRHSTELIDELLNQRPQYRMKVSRVKRIVIRRNGWRVPLAQGLMSRARLLMNMHEYAAAKDDLTAALVETSRARDRATTALCLEMFGDIHLMQNEYPQAIEKLTRAHDVNTEIGHRQGVANCLKSLGEIHRMQNEYPQAIEKLTRAHDVYSEIGHRLGVANCLKSLGDVHRMQDEYPQAIEKLTRAHDVNTEIGHRLGVANCLQILGEVHRVQSEYPKAIEKLARAHDVYSEIGDRLGVAGCLSSLGDVHYMQNEYPQAIEKLTRAHDVSSEIGDRQGVAGCLKSLGDVHRMQDEYPQAIEKVTRALDVYSEIGDRQGVAGCLESLGDIHRMQGEYPQAIEKVTRAHDVYSEIGDRLGVANCLQSLGEIHRMQGEYPQAIEKLTRAREVYSEIGSRRGVANCLQSLGDIHYMQAEYPQAIEKLTRAHDVYSELGDRLGVTGSLQSLADIDRVQERYDQAAEKLGRALHHASSIGHRYRIACCYMYMGLLDRDQRRYAEAVEHITTAQAMLTEIGQEGNADYCSGLLREIHELTISQDEGGEGPVIASHARDATTT
ncbi:TPR-like protein [Punctularia strigosozonata HHB-11173 SS5]|uniref:TPR-like protein n=1 Tax=Punctularia strigosozonata (strain HHB-11173) TaxID=741275 RepID=R7S1R0_PUNST|nr:TPR-like protein [Punctularia strigosozonata HHB-11173 SS5]EIN03779.1 TPR-like protein [Punctularia strigosozonata HHB-11173 SS5]